MVHGEVAKHPGLNLQFLGVGFPLHLVSCLQFFLRHDAEGFKHLDALWIEIALEDFRARFLHIETSLCGLLHPLVAISITVETDWLAGLDIFTKDIDDSMKSGAVFRSLKLIFCLLNSCVHPLLEVHKSFRHRTVERDHGRCAVGFRTDSTEFKTVTRESKR